jgi:hypothetical protein
MHSLLSAVPLDFSDVFDMRYLSGLSRRENNGLHRIAPAALRASWYLDFNYLLKLKSYDSTLLDHLPADMKEKIYKALILSLESIDQLLWDDLMSNKEQQLAKIAFEEVSIQLPLHQWHVDLLRACLSDRIIWSLTAADHQDRHYPRQHPHDSYPSIPEICKPSYQAICKWPTIVKEFVDMWQSVNSQEDIQGSSQSPTSSLIYLIKKDMRRTHFGKFQYNIGWCALAIRALILVRLSVIAVHGLLKIR